MLPPTATVAWRDAIWFDSFELVALRVEMAALMSALRLEISIDSLLIVSQVDMIGGVT